MRALTWLARRLRLVTDRSAVEREMTDEIRFHLDMEARALERGGLSPVEARRRAALAFGGIEAVKEAGRDSRGGRGLDDVRQDLRYAIRSLRVRPGFTAVALATLALGIGAATTIFSVVDVILLRPLPFHEPERLVTVWTTNGEPESEPMTSSPPDFREIETGARTFASVAAYTAADMNVGAAGETVRLSGARVSPALLRVLGAVPARGRAFAPAEGEYGAHHVALISHALWLGRLGSDPGALGRRITIDRESYTIVGIMPAGFAFPDRRTQLWVPLAFAPGDNSNTRGNYFLQIIGRLAPDASVALAQQDMNRIAAGVASRYPGAVMQGASVVALHDEVIGESGTLLYVLLGAVTLLLLIACTNIANLLLARGTVRRAEVALRTSLGATRTRLMRQLLVENLVLGLLGAAAGAVFAAVGIEVLSRIGPAELPRLDEVRLDSRILAVTAITGVATSILFGLVPALGTTRVAPADALRDGMRTSASAARRRLREALVAAEVAIALILLVGAGLLLRSFGAVLRVDPGFRADGLVTMSVALPESEYDAARMWRFHDALLERVRALPGVERAAATSALSLQGGWWGKQISFADRPEASSMDQVPALGYRVVSREYFLTMGVALRRGRDFEPTDRAGGAPVAIVNEAAAREYWPGADPIGRTIWLGPPERLIGSRLPDGYRFPRLEVVGVVADEHYESLDVPPVPEVYQLYEQVTETPSVMYLTIRASGNAETIAAGVRAAVRALDPGETVADVTTMAEVVRRSTAGRRFSLSLMAGFAAIALILAAVGLYGVVAYGVAQRRRELGIRIALGATRSSVVRLVVRDGLRPAVAGAALGLAASVLATQAITTMLFGVPPIDPVTYAVVCVLLLAVAIGGSLVPARRASLTPPMEALRAE